MSDECPQCEARQTVRAAITVALEEGDWSGFLEELTADSEVATCAINELIYTVCHLLLTWATGVAEHRGGSPSQYLSDVWQAHLLMMERADAAES